MLPERPCICRASQSVPSLASNSSLDGSNYEKIRHHYMTYAKAIADLCRGIYQLLPECNYYFDLTFNDDVDRWQGPGVEELHSNGIMIAAALPLSFHQDMFADDDCQPCKDKQYEYLFFMVLEVKNISPHNLEIGEVPTESLSYPDPGNGKIVQERDKVLHIHSIPSIKNAGYIIDQQRVDNGNVVVHSRSMYHAVVAADAQNFREWQKDENASESLLEQECCVHSPQFVHPTRKVLIVRIKKLDHKEE